MPNYKITKPSVFFLSRVSIRLLFYQNSWRILGADAFSYDYKIPCFIINRQYSMPSLPLPLAGHAHLFFNINREDILSTTLNLIKVETNQRKMMIFLGNQPVIWYHHPEPAEEILSSNEIISKSKEYVYLQVCMWTIFLLQISEKKNFCCYMYML